MYQISFYVPSSHKQEVKNAMFDAGAGRFKNYDCCSFEVEGKGQFRALEGSNPHIGKEGKIETVDEFKVDMVCKEENVKSVINAMKLAHPYEEVAYSIIKIESIGG